jgi:peptidoglycan hydrolase-like protein with peptidoglycan-binding domain
LKANKYTRTSKIHHLSYTTTIAALFSVILILSAGGIGLPLLQQQQEAYASVQPQGPSSMPSPSLPPAPSSQLLPPPLPHPPTPICDPQSPITLQLGSTGAKVAELQRILTQVGYGSLLLGQGGGIGGAGGIDGKFTTSTQNAVKKFQQDNRLPVEGKVRQITWAALCGIIPNSFIVQLKSIGSNPFSPLSSRPPTPSSVMEIIDSLTPQLAAAGGRIVAVYDQFGMFNVVFEGPQAKREQFINSLRANPAVQVVFNDHIVSATQLPPQPQQQTIPTGINRVDADLSAAKSGDGGGPEVDADIAILDSGVNRHPDLNLFQCVSFLYFASIPFPLCNDRSDHGTMVAGVAAAKDNNVGVVGTAPGARIWALKVLGDNGNGDESDAIEGLNYVAAHAREIEVANLSFEQAGFSFPFLATSILVLRGVVVIAAAGNSNIDANSVAPANIPWAITVSAMTDSDGKCGGAGPAIPALRKHWFQPNSIRNPDDFFRSSSNYGSVIDLAAPGSRINSTNNVTGYSTASGTSFAAPHVSGAAALYKSLHPTANSFQVDAFLKSTGTKAPATGNPRLPCDGAGRGYFDDRYLPLGILVLTDKVKEPLLYMGAIK